MLPTILREYTSAPIAHLNGIVNSFPDGHNLVVIAQPGYAIRERHNVKIIPLRMRRFRSATPSALFGSLHASLSIYRTAMTACKREQVDILYARDGVCSLPAALLAKRLHLPLILEVNGMLHSYDEMEPWLQAPQWYLKLVGKVIRIMEAFSFRTASKLMCISRVLRDVVVDKYGVPDGKILVLDNGADTSLFRPIGREPALHKIGLSESFRWVVFTGSLVLWQGVDKLIDAVPQVVATLPNVRFLIVGDGPQRDKLFLRVQKLKLADKVLFTGHVAHGEVPWYINCGDVCVAPYFAPEGRCWWFSPLKLFEYMACGKAVIVSDIPGIADHVKKHRAGRAVPAGDSVSLSEAIIELLNDAKSRREMGERGRQAVLSSYDWREIAKSIAEECEKVVSNIDGR